MARINPSRAFVKKTFHGFTGIGSQSPLGGKGASDMCNFRIHPDGSLVLREGSKRLLTFPNGKIRGFWEGNVGGNTLCFAVAGSSVYRVALSDATYSLCTTLGTSSGKVSFVVFSDTLYLLDGQEIRCYQATSDSFATIQPYVPLYGKNWSPSAGGYVNEPFNLLTTQIRVHYQNEAGITSFKLPYAGEAIQSVTVPGKSLTDYSFTQYSNTVSIPSASSYTEVVIAYTVSMFTDTKNGMHAAQGALACRLEQKESLLLYDTPLGNRVYCSCEVSDTQLASCNAVYPSALPLYFRESDVLLLGTREEPVCKILPYYDGLLALNESGAWYLERDEEDGITASAVLDGMGISNANAATVCENTVAVANAGGVFLLKATSSRTGALQAECISLPIAQELSDTLLQNAMLFKNPRTNELWLCRPDHTPNSIWVWSLARKEWYRFHGFAPILFFSASCGIGFASNASLCIFDEALASDSTTPISCYYTGDYMDFDAADTPRRTVRASVCAKLHEGDVNLSISTEGFFKSFVMKGSSTTAPEYFDFRMRTGRHRFLRFRLYSYAPHVGLTIHKVAFYGNR